MMMMMMMMMLDGDYRLLVRHEPWTLIVSMLKTDLILSAIFSFKQKVQNASFLLKISVENYRQTPFSDFSGKCRATE